MKFVWPPLNRVIEERQKTIADGLAASERAEKDLENARATADEELNAAKKQAAELIDRAKKRAAKLFDEETSRGHAEREKIIASGYTEVEAERVRVREELRQQVAALAMAGAAQSIESVLDANKHRDIVESVVLEW